MTGFSLYPPEVRFIVSCVPSRLLRRDWFPMGSSARWAKNVPPARFLNARSNPFGRTKTNGTQKGCRLFWLFTPPLIQFLSRSMNDSKSTPHFHFEGCHFHFGVPHFHIQTVSFFFLFTGKIFTTPSMIFGSISINPSKLDLIDIFWYTALESTRRATVCMK